MGIRDRPTAPRSPWQNGYCERAIGSIRRECLDHVVVFGERHLRRLLRSYATYYNEARTHLSVNKDAPSPLTVHAVGGVSLRHFSADFIICTCEFEFRHAQRRGSKASSSRGFGHYCRSRRLWASGIRPRDICLRSSCWKISWRQSLRPQSPDLRYPRDGRRHD